MVDEIKVKITAGRGGNGCVAFEKGPGKKGVSGGDGGNGGSVYMEAVSDLSALRNYRFKKEFQAENGQDGRNKLLAGKNGEDLILKVPIGTVAHNLDAEEDLELTEVGQKVRLAKGGKGGRGNWHFRTAERQSPDFAEQGRSEESFDYHIELKLIADIGFIGLPSAGKSSLLNAFTRARAKVAAYPFTTLEPNLGVYHTPNRQIILADIPGLIEGAHKGKGLGDKFLRHIQRTKYLFHCISSESEDLAGDYQAIRAELRDYDTKLAKKSECIILTKVDLLDEATLNAKVETLKKINPCVFPASVLELETLEAIKEFIQKVVEEN
ncbi:MAG: GTPase ObgE [bacterium]|nr:GTPase ObgE [bacterium]